jgi:hypothetical protein
VITMGVRPGVMPSVNEHVLSKVRPLVPSGLLVLIAFVTLGVPIQARAQFTANGNVTGQFESNSNIFALPSGNVPPAFNGLRRADSLYAYGAQAEVDYLWGVQKFYATAHATQYDYQHLTELNHSDYQVDTGLTWKLGDSLDGTASVTRTHAIVPFTNLLGTAGAVSLLTLSDELRETLLVDFALNPNWKTVGSAFYSLGDQSTPHGFVTQLKQTSGTVALDYLGIGALTSGLSIGYLTGDYDGFNPLGAANPSYTQSNLALVADYTHTRTVFEGQLGYSRRTSDTQSNSTSGITGLFNLKRQLTPKTSITAKIDRTINSYFLNTSSEIDTDAGLTVSWQSTYKLAATVGYTFTYRDLPGQNNNPVGTNRVDIQEDWTLALIYRPERWLSIRPYANLLTRRSTLIGGAFDSTVFGVYFTFYRR